MLNRWMLVSVVCVALVISGCSQAPTKQDQGVMIGAIAGGLLGSRFGHNGGRALATMVGAMAGAAIGGSIGQSMDRQDQINTQLALENVRTGVSTTWVNPDSGNQYEVTPTSTYETDNGPCREYTMNATIGGKTEEVYGTACRQADGSWKIQN